MVKANDCYKSVFYAVLVRFCYTSEFLALVTVNG